MRQMNFLFGIHNHQPVGNFDGVFEESFKRSYLPFLEVLSSHPGIRISLHCSGPLWDWSKQKCPEFIDLVGKLLEKDQIELLGGGYYEPLLSIIPQGDAVGQIHMMRDFLKSTFGKDPEGIWLTERVWEPHLPDLLHRAGVKYTIIDESHFRLSGLRKKHITGYYNTEKYGNSVYLFPINKTLRYSIPFKMPHETIDLLREISNEDIPTVTYGDDGEKFGIWPQTYKWVFEEKWLHNFFEEVERNSDWIKMPTFSEVILQSEPSGRIYLPTASYFEMMEWALPHEAANDYKNMLKDLEKSGKKDQFQNYLRGGIWSNFLAKYPESNQMYKRSLLTSNRLEELSAKYPQSIEIEKARKHLYKGQCNCAYWHGLFGGVYLNYLRHAIYENIIEADKILDKLEHSGHRFFCDQSRENFFDKSSNEIVLSTKDLTAIISPGLGASLAELDYKAKSFNLSNVIARRRESYHSDIERIINQGGKEQDGVRSIHDISHVKDERIKNKLQYDDYPKFSFIEHYTMPDIEPQTIFSGTASSIKSPALGPFKTKAISTIDRNRACLAEFTQQALLNNKDPLTIDKSYEIGVKNPSIKVKYEFQNKGSETLSFLMAIELNLTLLAGNDEQRYLMIEGGQNLPMSKAINISTDNISLVDEWNKFRVLLQPSEEMMCSIAPLETVSQSESGFELTYQGTTLLFSKVFDIKAKDSAVISILLKASQL